jgi:hypothetical protein
MFSKNPEVFYRTSLPTITGEFYAQLDDCIKSLKAIAQELDADLFKLVVFHDLACEDENLQRNNYTRNVLVESFPGKCPTFVLVCQSPEAPYAVSAEAGFVKRGSCRTVFRNLENIHYVVMEWSGFRELWASGLAGKNNVKTYAESAVGAFDAAHAVLEAEKMNFNQIVRQWNYIGGILHDNVVSMSHTINYQIFNEIRHQFYQQYRTETGFPAATGIGSNSDKVILEICAVQADSQDLKTYAIENPDQVNPYQYGQQVLEGVPILSQQVKHPPEFERAKLVIMRDYIRLFISGTASIIGQETIGIGEIEKQTLCTISNIEKLSDFDHIKKTYPLLPAGSFEYSFIRVYVKEKSDLKRTKSICRQKFRDIPISYIVTDICRSGLLVEIEGEMRFRRSED